MSPPGARRVYCLLSLFLIDVLSVLAPKERRLSQCTIYGARRS